MLKGYIYYLSLKFKIFLNVTTPTLKIGSGFFIFYIELLDNKSYY